MLTVLDRYREYGVTLLRVMLGIVFLMHGYLVAFVFTPTGLAGFNVAMGIPLPSLTAWFVILGHFLGGTALVLGWYARWGALVHLPIMAGALGFVHLRQGFFMTGIILDPVKGRAVAGGYEYVLLLLICSAAIVLLGSGPLSVDAAKRP